MSPVTMPVPTCFALRRKFRHRRTALKAKRNLLSPPSAFTHCFASKRGEESDECGFSAKETDRYREHNSASYGACGWLAELSAKLRSSQKPPHLAAVVRCGLRRSQA